MRRLIVLFVAVLAMVATFITPAGARPPSAGAGSTNEKVTICHATRSLQNPYVVITIDVAAWQPDGGDDPRAHGPNHDREKTDSDGIVQRWGDKLFVDGQGTDGCGESTPPPPSAATCVSRGDDIYVVNFGPDALISHHPGWLTNLTEPSVGTFSIPSGEYLVTLGSQDLGHPVTITEHNADQVNEMWRADFGSGVYSEYSDDLPNTDKYGETVVRNVTLYKDFTTSIIAEHWDYDNPPNHSVSPDSIVPVCVALVRVGDAITVGG